MVNEFLSSKGFAALGGFLGGLSVSFFWQPRRLKRYGLMTAGAIVGALSVASAIMICGLIASYLGLDFNQADIALGLGYIVGLLSVGVINLIAGFFDKREDSDIVEVVRELQTHEEPKKVTRTRKPSKATQATTTE